MHQFLAWHPYQRAMGASPAPAGRDLVLSPDRREGARLPIAEESPVVALMADRQLARVSLLDVREEVGLISKIFRDLADADFQMPLIVPHGPAAGRTALSFLLAAQRFSDAQRLFHKWLEDGFAGDIAVDRDVAVLSLIVGARASAPFAARLFSVLAREHIPVDCLVASERTVACVIRGTDVDGALRAAEAEFFQPCSTSAPGTSV